MESLQPVCEPAAPFPQRFHVIGVRKSYVGTRSEEAKIVARCNRNFSFAKGLLDKVHAVELPPSDARVNVKGALRLNRHGKPELFQFRQQKISPVGQP